MSQIWMFEQPLAIEVPFMFWIPLLFCMFRLCNQFTSNAAFICDHTLWNIFFKFAVILLGKWIRHFGTCLLCINFLTGSEKEDADRITFIQRSKQWSCSNLLTKIVEAKLVLFDSKLSWPWIDLDWTQRFLG